MFLLSLFDKIKFVAIIIILFSLFSLLFHIWFPHEAFCMDPFEYITSDEDISDEDVRSRLIIAKKESYTSYNGKYTYNTRQDLTESLYPNGLSVDNNIITDYYDNENYFDIPITMIYGESKNIDLSPGTYSGCIAINIDGLLIWPERLAFHAEFVKDYTQVITNDSNISSVSLGTRVIDKFVFIYIKCQDINGRKYHWTIWEKSSLSRYWSYKAFKKRWDSETSVWSNINDNIRNDIIIEVKDLLGIKRVNASLRKSIRTELEKLLRRRPFLTIPS